MRNLILENKTGFSTNLPFEIFDRWGNLFYSNQFTNRGKNLTMVHAPLFKFNLPAGTYKYNGVFYKLKKPLNFKFRKLPPIERKKPIKKFKIIFAYNPNKCSIYYNLGFIIFDNQFKKAPIYQIYDIYYHELGHHFYKTESFADMYASNQMLKIGFNPSQIGRVALQTLSESQNYRKEIKVKTLKNARYE